MYFVSEANETTDTDSEATDGRTSTKKQATPMRVKQTRGSNIPPQREPERASRKRPKSYGPIPRTKDKHSQLKVEDEEHGEDRWSEKIDKTRVCTTGLSGEGPIELSNRMAQKGEPFRQGIG